MKKEKSEEKNTKKKRTNKVAKEQKETKKTVRAKKTENKKVENEVAENNLVIKIFLIVLLVCLVAGIVMSLNNKTDNSEKDFTAEDIVNKFKIVDYIQSSVNIVDENLQKNLIAKEYPSFFSEYVCKYLSSNRKLFKEKNVEVNLYYVEYEKFIQEYKNAYNKSFNDDKMLVEKNILVDFSGVEKTGEKVDDEALYSYKEYSRCQEDNITKCYIYLGSGNKVNRNYVIDKKIEQKEDNIINIEITTKENEGMPNEITKISDYEFKYVIVDGVYYLDSLVMTNIR